MKKMMMALSLLAAVAAGAQSKEERTMQDLVGSWRNSRGAGLDIEDSNTVYIVRGNQRKRAAASVSDLRKNPVSFNLTVKDSARLVTLKGVLMIVGHNTLQWQVYESETKPVSYTAGNRGDMLFLKRIDRLLN